MDRTEAKMGRSMKYRENMDYVRRPEPSPCFNVRLTSPVAGFGGRGGVMAMFSRGNILGRLQRFRRDGLIAPDALNSLDDDSIRSFQPVENDALAFRLPADPDLAIDR